MAPLGSGKEKVLTATIYVTDLSKKAEMNAAWDRVLRRRLADPGDDRGRGSWERGYAAGDRVHGEPVILGRK
ncbi:MAG: hypothetical protein WDN49_10205 [Acetobacteraceae bacterium]